MSEAHRLIGLALGVEAGSRLTNHLAVPTSPDTLLRRVKQASRQSHPTPRVLGIDDFAFRRGDSYGTILMDLERRVVVDLLPDRAAGTLVAWLNAHSGVEVVSRDRASAYAQASRDAATKATQVADRFHLLMNLRTARQERFDHVRQLHRDGVSLRQIAHSLRLHFWTVQKYIRGEESPVWRSALKGMPTPSPLDPFRDQIRERVKEGASSMPRRCSENCGPKVIPAVTARSDGQSNT